MPEINRSISAGLRRLCKQQLPGQTFSRQEIARACKCSEGAIRRIEKIALERLKAKAAKLHTLEV